MIAYDYNLMAKKCAITGKSSLMASGYSNRVRATKYNPTVKARRYANLQTKTIFVPEINKKVKITVSTRGLKTIAKLGAFQALKQANLI